MERRHEVIAALILDLRRDGAAFVKILAARHQLAAEGLHGRVLLARIAFGHDDHHRHAVARGGKRDRLAVIAARRCDQSFEAAIGAAQGIHINKAAAGFERSGRRVVLMLDHDRGADPFGEQRPGISRRRRHIAANGRGGGGKFVEGEQRHRSQFRGRNTTKCDIEKLTRKLARIATALASHTGNSRISAANSSVAVLTSNPATPEATKVR